MAKSGKYGRVKTEFGNIPDEEPVFILRGQDKLACETVRLYAKLRRKGGDDKGAAACLKAAQRMSDWPKKKLPD